MYGSTILKRKDIVIINLQIIIQGKILLKVFFDSIKSCLKISFEASIFYSLIRLFSSLIRAILNILLIFVEAKILSFLSIYSDISNGRVILCILSLPMILLLFKVIDLLENYSKSMHEELIEKYLNNQIMELDGKVDLELFDSQEYRDSIEKFKTDIEIVNGLLWIVLLLIQCFVILVSSFIIVAKNSFILAIVVVLSTLPICIVNKKYVTKIYQIEIDTINKIRYQAYISRIFSDKEYAMDIRLYEMKNSLINRYNNYWKDVYYKKKAAFRERNVWTMITSFMHYITFAYIYISIIVDVVNNNKDVGYYSLMYAALLKLITSIYSFYDCIYQIYESELKIENIQRFKCYKSKIKDGERILESGRIQIEFENVYFTYPNCDNYALENVSFKIEDGIHCAIIGRNGSGKSTIIKLLLRFYDVDQGRILINGYNIKEYDIKNLRNSFSVFFQESKIYGFSLGENISMKLDDKIDDDKIKKLFEQCDANDIYSLVSGNMEINMLKNLNNSAIELSGGQRQKISLIRTFYRKADAYILDEPSAYLDPVAERKMLSCMKNQVEGHTTIYISHRMSTLDCVEKIILMDNGKIINIGTHYELYMYSELYKRMIDSQEYNTNHGKV